MRNFYLLVVLLVVCGTIEVSAQQVPEKMKFADMVLEISPAARKKIQASVDELVRSPKHFQIKVDRAHLYFPYIEQAFRQENLPEDFKYLVLQESGLVSDAVSSSNAIGFWQFKEPAAMEAGLAINSKVDERMHIIRASLGAARYLKQNNIHFGNWIYALQAYNTGAGGTKKTANSKYFGKKKMDIEATTHWYVLKFLAHKVAFDDAFRKKDSQPLELVEYRCKNESLNDIAKKFKIELEDLKMYNKWLKVNKVPDDRAYYSIMLPVKKEDAVLAKEKAQDEVIHIAMEEGVEETKKEDHVVPKAERLPGWFMKRKRTETTPDNPHIVSKINHLIVIKAKEGDTKDVLAINGGIRTKKLLKYNDVKSFHKIEVGKFYYLQSKKNKHFSRYHVVLPGETMWGISQEYGLKLNALARMNRMKPYAPLKYGMKLYLKSTRPKNKPIEYMDIKIPEETLPVIKKEEEKKEIKRAEDVIKELPAHKKVEIDSSKLHEEVEKEINKEQERHKTLIYHTVEQGESLFSIAKKYQTTPEEIQQWNELSDNTIEIDQRLIVGWQEDLKPDQGDFIIHVVKQKETLYSISKMYGVSIPEIMEWNNKTEQSLNIDEALRILKK